MIRAFLLISLTVLLSIVDYLLSFCCFTFFDVRVDVAVNIATHLVYFNFLVLSNGPAVLLKFIQKLITAAHLRCILLGIRKMAW